MWKLFIDWYEYFVNLKSFLLLKQKISMWMRAGHTRAALIWICQHLRVAQAPQFEMRPDLTSVAVCAVYSRTFHWTCIITHTHSKPVPKLNAFKLVYTKTVSWSDEPDNPFQCERKQKHFINRFSGHKLHKYTCSVIPIQSSPVASAFWSIPVNIARSSPSLTSSAAYIATCDEEGLKWDGWTRNSPLGNCALKVFYGIIKLA